MVGSKDGASRHDEITVEHDRNVKQDEKEAA